MSMLEVALDPAAVIVAVDPGKVMNRVWVSNGSGLLASPFRCRCRERALADWSSCWLNRAAAEPVIAVEATGSLHRCWAAELERLHPGSVRIFAPSEIKAARIQLGSGRFKTDDRDCAALTYLARQGAGRRHAEESAVDALRAAVRHRRGLVADRKVAQQRLHAQLNALCPGSVGPRWARSVAAGGLADRAGGVGVCGRVRRSAAEAAVTDCPGSGPTDPVHRAVLAAPLARVFVSTGRCPAAGPATGPGLASLPGPAMRHHRARRGDHRAAGRHRWADFDHHARGRGHPGRHIRGFQPAHRAVPRRRAPVLGDRFGARPLRVGDPASPRPDLPAGPGRTPRCIDGHRLGTVNLFAGLRPTQRRTPRSRYGPDPGPGGVGPQRLPSCISAPTNRRTLR